MAPIQPFLKKFLIDNFKPLFSSNELGALGNLSSTTDDLTKKFGGLREFEITGDDLTQAFGDKVRAIDMTKENAPPFQSGYTKLVKDPLKDFTMRGQVGAIQPSPTLANPISARS